MTTPNLNAVETAAIAGRLTRLRPMTPNEAPLAYAWARDPDIEPFWGGRGHYTSLAQFLDDWKPHYFDGSQPHLGRCFAIEAEGRPIGMIAYNRIDLRHRSTEIDIIIGHKPSLGRGYGTDAIRAFLRFLFDTLGLHRVWLGTYRFNRRAIRAYQKAGFVREGLLRQADWVDGRWVDVVLMSVLEDEFRAREAESA